ncbi:MAG: tRNA glutamyl-Q(34) synthetase GluQRS [Porticoccaceae bacterium]|nr:tRNA glutamyl-Q(34) synthetase GluQRS [Porticoccaceae bacterium]
MPKPGDAEFGDTEPGNPSPYIGRFAPSPTGPLHAGSLVAALASYLDARAAHGQWLLRIEDIDPPREIPGASDLILTQLDAHGLHWDGTACYQSQRLEYYLSALKNLAAQNLLFACTCTRERVRANAGQYDGSCRAHLIQAKDISIAADNATPPNNAAAHTSTSTRIRTDAHSLIAFDDLIKGPQRVDLHTAGGDFIVRRRDQLFAYQLAVAVDDAEQNISHVLRGGDLLDSTPRQIFLINLLDSPATPPRYGHIPMMVNQDDQKLSKQHHAPSLELGAPGENLYHALEWLNQSPPQALLGANPDEVLDWAINHWDRGQVTSVERKPYDLDKPS